MIEKHCMGPDVDRSRISPDARITGASYITGPRTALGPGAVVHDSRLHDVVVKDRATVTDSIVVAESSVSAGDQPVLASGAYVAGSTLTDVSVGERSRVVDTWARDCRLGPDNAVTEAKLAHTRSGAHVTVIGPTEVEDARLGHHATVDHRGYLEGLFSNTFPQVKFDESSGRLLVTGTIDLPHLSRYGTNTINSTNSGKLLPQPDGVVRGFGPHVGLWHGSLLSHEQIALGPCCWIVPWTKVIGQSPAAHDTDEELVNDPLTTYVMSFAMAGLNGQSTRGLVMPGELSVGFGPKQRKGAWVFTYAPDAVIRMVRRIYDALEPERRHVADTIVVEALRTALEMTRAMAARRRVDLSVPHTDQRPGWPRWISRTYALLSAHLEGRIWEFSEGQPTEWRKEGGHWVHPRFSPVLAIAPDAFGDQMSEEEIFAFEDPVPPVRMPVPSGAVDGSEGQAQIDATAQVAPDAVIGPGCRIGPNTVVESGAVLWNSVLEGCRIGKGACVQRSVLAGSTVGPGATVRSCRMTGSVLGDDSTADAAGMANARLAPHSTVSAFADVADAQCDYTTIIGGAFHSADVEVYLMSMHMAGGSCHLKGVPVVVDLDGEKVVVPAIPMLGGGSLIRGTNEQPVEMAGCFIGSNAIIERNTYVGFGGFVLGTLGPDAGLLPFTMSAGGPATHEIGAVLTRLASTVITHIIGWTYQAVGPRGARAVAAAVRHAIREGIEVIECELARRRADSAPAVPVAYARYRSLRDYSEDQLRTGLETYRRTLESGAWELAFEDGELRFSSAKGRWVERRGSALWQPRQADAGPKA